MSETGRSGREVAHRIFAAEFRDATHAFTRGDEERAPNYVVSPTGALMNRLFVVGVLTAVERVNDETVRARVADPTGTFVVYASQYQPDARATLRELDTPAFVAVTGKANTFTGRDGGQVYTSIRPEAVAAVDAETRDHWAVTTAEHTLARLGQLARALTDGPRTSEGISIALEQYEPSPAYVASLYRTCIQVLELVAGERDSVETTADSSMGGEPDVSLANVIEVSNAVTVTPPSSPIGTDTPSDETEPVEAATDVESESADIESHIGESGMDAASAPPAPEDRASDPEDAPQPRIEPDEPVVSEDERQEIETEFGTEFSTGDEIDPPEEALEATSGDDGDDEDEAEETEEALADRLVTLLEEQDDGEGVAREALVELASDRFEADPEAVQEAVRTAMMDGRCYEPADGILRPV